MDELNYIVDTTKIYEIVLTQSSGNAGLKWRLGAVTRIRDIGEVTITEIYHDQAAYLLQGLQRTVVEGETETGHLIRLKSYATDDLSVTYDVASQVSSD